MAEFYVHVPGRLLKTRCKSCCTAASAKSRAAHPEKRLLCYCKHRAKAQGLAFNLTEADIVIPTHCPILGLALTCPDGGKKRPATVPTVDRIVPSRGYIRGNVVIISWRANRLKSDASLEELQALASFYGSAPEQ